MFPKAYAYCITMKYKERIVHLITLIVVAAVSIQLYWNYSQYLVHKGQVQSDVQRLLDRVLTVYNAQRVIRIPLSDSTHIFPLPDTAALQRKDAVIAGVIGSLKALRNQEGASRTGSGEPDIYSLLYSRVDLTVLDTMIGREFKNNNYTLQYYLTTTENGKVTDTAGKMLPEAELLIARARIAPFLDHTYVTVHYSNPFWPSLMKGVAGIILSLVLCIVVIFALYYLLYIIRHQKQLSEIRNDFVSNITHEFKTPIATASSAVEAIKHFNTEQDPVRTHRYLDIAAQQLEKLDQLVEKVMETSRLEHSGPVLHRQMTDVVLLVKSCMERSLLTTEKQIILDCEPVSCRLTADVLHLENVFSNLIDNAVKYGGDVVTVRVRLQGGRLQIAVSDNGRGISKAHRPYVFDQFYRVPNRNIHNVKGFGVGLYYSKKIVEQHGGTLQLTDHNTFLLSLWIK